MKKTLHSPCLNPIAVDMCSDTCSLCCNRAWHTRARIIVRRFRRLHLKRHRHTHGTVRYGYGTVPLNDMRCGMTPHGMAHHGTARHNTARHGTALHGNVVYGTAQPGTAPHGNMSHGTALHRTTLHGSVLHCTAPHRTALHRTAHRHAWPQWIWTGCNFASITLGLTLSTIHASLMSWYIHCHVPAQVRIATLVKGVQDVKSVRGLDKGLAQGLAEADIVTKHSKDSQHNSADECSLRPI